MADIKRSWRRAIVGKVVLVTGASSGIGETTALEFGRAGAAVVLAARRADRLEHLAERIRAGGAVALAVPTDLTDGAQIARLVKTSLTSFDRIDVLANIAGWGRYDWFEEMSADDLRRHYDVNVIGLAELTRQVLPAMKDRRSGFILNMCSYASKIAVPPLSVYASTKYAVEGLTDALRRELIPWGIRVMRIHPSAVPGTEFNQQAARHGGLRYRSIPIGRVSRERVARAMVRLVERPRRAVFLSHLYDVPALANLLVPGMIDILILNWVRTMRRRDLESDPAEVGDRW